MPWNHPSRILKLSAQYLNHILYSILMSNKAYRFAAIYSPHRVLRFAELHSALYFFFKRDMYFVRAGCLENRNNIIWTNAATWHDDDAILRRLNHLCYRGRT